MGQTLLDRYLVGSVLGEGGMGKVYLAEQRMGNATRRVAIKTLHSGLSNDPSLVARFYRESETVVALEHPNTIQFYDFGTHDGMLFIVMEYIDGQSLADVLDEGPLHPARVDKLLVQICGSLNEAHQIGVVHRDLKPENVLLTDRAGHTDFVKVLDFGIAKRSEAQNPADVKLTQQGAVLGTPPYMSPEQFSGDALDARSDIYSLATMTYELLTGALPFEANTAWEWAAKHLNATPNPPSSPDPSEQLPPHKVAAIMQALAKSPDERQPDVLAFLREFTGKQDAQAAWTEVTTGHALHGYRPEAPPKPRATEQSKVVSVVKGPRQTAPDPHASTHHGTGPVSMAEPAIPKGKAPWLLIAGAGLAILGGLAWWASAQGSPQRPDPETTSKQSTPPDIAPRERVPLPTGVEPPPNRAVQRAALPELDEKPAGRSTPKRRTPRGQQTNRNPKGAQGSNSAGDALKLAKRAIDRDQVDRAITELRRAQRVMGPKHIAITNLRNQIAARGGLKIALLIQQGECPKAQRLYKRLKTIKAERAAKLHFSKKWCPSP